MAQRGVDGTSMRDLASATGLNVASLYHYFPSKRDLLVAVLEERGIMSALAANVAGAPGPDPERALADELHQMLASMLEIEEFIRLMLGEVLRGDETALTVGTELMNTTLASLEHWLRATLPEPASTDLAPERARLLRAWLIGIFFEYVAGVMTETESEKPDEVFRRRAAEAARVLLARPPGT